MQCLSCSSRDIEFNESAGHAVCVQCGMVLEENTIVSSIEFQESGDRSQIVGQFVSGNCSQSSFGAGPRGRGRYGFSRDSRDATLSNARRVISQVISTLRLPTHYIDKANRLYSLALQRNFLFGRRQIHVVAAVTYTVARQENSPHLLIDFSDVLQVNVYVIGQCFLQLIRLLSLRLPIVDPSLFIHRFAARMELGSSAGAVAVTAMRTISRMKKDWINTGRRPDGVCAAAVLVASRAHGFDRSLMEVAKTFRMSVQTISRRLQDFSLTPSAQLTVEQFQVHDILAEFDPPSFIRGQIENGLLEAAKATDDDAADDEAFLGESESHSLLPGGGTSMSLQLRVESTAGPAADGSRTAPSYAEGGATELNVKFLPTDQSLSGSFAARNENRQRLYADIYSELGGAEASSALASEAADVARTVLVGVGRNLPFVMSIGGVDGGFRQSGVLRKRHSRTNDTVALIGRPRTELPSHTQEVSNPDGEGTSEALNDLLDIDGAEIDTFILNADEQKKRSAIWERMHRGYIDEREARRVQKENDTGKKTKRDVVRTENVATAIASIVGASTGAMGQQSKRARTDSGPDAAAAQQQSSVAFIKKSKKINFNALQSVMDFDDGKFVQPRVSFSDAPHGEHHVGGVAACGTVGKGSSVISVPRSRVRPGATAQL